MTATPIPSTTSANASPLRIKRLFDAGLRRAPEQEIVYADKRRLSYREFGARVSRLASGLASLGVEAGDTVAVMDWDTHRYLECFFALPMMGTVLHTINVRLSPEQILYTINHARDDVILVNAEFIPVLEQIWSRVDAGKRLVLLSDAGAAPETSLEFVAEYESLLAASSPRFDFPELDENTRATTFYTTGTTGLPKGVYFSHRQLVLHALAVRDALAGSGQGRFDDGDVYMPITPMFHVHAWGLPYVATMLGVKQVYPGRYVSDQLVELLRREKVSFSHCVPTILQMVLDGAKARGVDLSGWTVIIGGAALAQALARQAVEQGVDIFGGYGMSETGPVLALAQLQPHMRDWDIDRQVDIRCKTGRAIALVDLRIVDEAMNDLPHDGKTSGELVVRAPWLTQGYLDDPQNSEKLWHGGWLHTGDIAVIDASGYVKITDRLKDVIKTGGEWISSLDLEDLILRHPCVAEVAVIGMPDPKWTERPVALVIVKADGTGVDLANAKMSMNPFDEIAVEEAVKLKEAGIATEVVAVSCGSAACQETLRTAMAIGADRGILVETAAELQPLAVAKLLRALVEREQPTLVVMGKQAIDGDANQTGQMLAELLRWPQATFASKLRVDGETATVTREVDGGLETIEIRLPAVDTTDLRLNEPRYVTLPNIMKAKKKPLEVTTPDALAVDCTPRLVVLGVAEPPKRAAGIKVGDVAQLLDKLRNEARALP